MAARKGVKEAIETVTQAAQTKTAVTKAAARSTEGSKPVASASTVSPNYPIHELMAESEALLGVKPEVFAGALEGAAKETLQVKEAIQLVEQFLRKKVL